MTTPPCFRKVNPGDFPVLYVSLSSRHHAAVDGRRIRRDHAGAADFAVARHRPGAGLRRAEIRRARPGRSGRGGGAQHFARRHPHRRRQGQFQHAGRHAAGPERRRDAARHRRDAARGRLPRRGRGLSQRRAGQAQRDRARRSTASRTTRSRPGSTTTRAIVLAIQRQPDANTVEVVDVVRAELPAIRAQVPAVDPDGDAVRPLDLDPRGGRRRAGDAGDRHLRW